MSEATFQTGESYRFGGYEILETTGRGGMGVVYRAVDRNLGRVVALKVLRDELRSQPHIVQRFQLEAQAIAALDHPNIVRVYSVGVIGRIPYIAMEFLEGRPLSEYLLEEGTLPWRRALQIGKQVAEALACAHKAGIIHRDIKPANILIDEEGRVSVTDFGIAKIMNATKRLTIDGSRLGTPQYMSPERCRNQPVRPASDIYSLGVVLFQTISGRLPYEAASAVELVQRIASEDPARLRQYTPEAPDAVERLLAFMIEKRPEDRPGSAARLAAVIERVLEGRPLDEHGDDMSNVLAAFRESLPPSTPVPTPTPAQRKPAARQRLRSAWFRLPAAVRLGMAGTACLLVLGLTGMMGYRTLSPALQASAGITATAQDTSPWFAPSQLATYQRETPEVILATLELPGFEINQLFWSRDGRLAVQADGTSDTPWNGHRAVVLLSPGLFKAHLVVPPTPSPAEEGFHLAGAVPGGVLLAANGNTFVLGQNTGYTLRAVLNTPVRALVERGGTQIAAMAHLEKDDWGLARSDTGQVGDLVEGQSLKLPGSVQAFSATPSLTTTVYLTRANGLWSVQEGKEPRMIAQQAKDLSPQGLHENGHAVVAAYKEEGISQIGLWHLERNIKMTNLGPGSWAGWIPERNQVLILAKDHAGRNQLWVADPVAPIERRQLTHLGTGVTSAIALSPDGQCTATALQGVSVVALVQIR